MGNLVGKLLIDEWFKMIAFGGFVLVVLSLTVKLQIDNPLALCIGFGLMFVGVAEMAMRPYREGIQLDTHGRPQFKIGGRMRHMNTPGCILYLVAVAFLLGAAWRAWMLFYSA